VQIDVLDLGAGRGQTKRPLFAFYIVPLYHLSASNVGVMIVVRGMRGAEGSRLRMLAIFCGVNVTAGARGGLRIGTPTL
jgi:hypothetical protein